MERKGENQNKDLGREAAGRQWELPCVCGILQLARQTNQVEKPGVFLLLFKPVKNCMNQVQRCFCYLGFTCVFVDGHQRLDALSDLRFQNQHYYSPRFPLVLNIKQIVNGQVREKLRPDFMRHPNGQTALAL